MPFSLYRIFNTINHRTYIGVSSSPRKRISAHLCGKGSREIAKDVEEFDRNVFVSQVLADFDTEAEANRRMQTLIMRQNALYPNGYNMGLGGHGSRGHIWNRRQRQKISGSKNKRSKITEADAVAIYWDPRKRSEIAKEYGISTTMVTKIKKGRAWRHVTQ